MPHFIVRFAAPLATALAPLAGAASARVRGWRRAGPGGAPAPADAHVRALEAQVAALQAELRTHDRQLRLGRLVAGLVHDLSHPIQNIANNVTLLLRDELDAGERDAVHRIIEREQRALRRVMDDILDVARPRPAERALVDIGAAIVDVVDAMQAEARTVGVTLNAQCPCDLPPARGDRFALTRVFHNLVANALHATPAGGTITLRAYLDEVHVRVDVVDTGSGIAGERLATLFDAFVTTRQRGHGLGLAVSKQMVDQMDGTLTVQSRLGLGTTFTLRLRAALPERIEAAS